jgi:hypothetical protein
MTSYVNLVRWLLMLLVVSMSEVRAQEENGDAGRIPAPVYVRLQQAAQHYKTFAAFEQSGDATIEAKVKGSETKSAAGATYIGIIRKSDFFIEFGSSAMVGDNHKLAFYDFPRRRVYIFPPPNPNTMLRILDISNPGSDDAARAFADLVDRSLRRSSDSKMAASAFGFSAAASIVLSFLTEGSPEKALLNNVKSAEIREDGPSSCKITLNYDFGRVEELQLVDDTFKSIKVVFGAQELAELSEEDAQLEKLIILWQARNMIVDATTVKEDISKRNVELNQRAAKYEQRLAAALPADRTPVPTPPGGKGLVSYIKAWLQSLL